MKMSRTGHQKNKHTYYTQVGHVGDQLAIERGLNSLLSVSNGFTSEERLDGIYLEVADWHTDLKLLDVCLIVLHVWFFCVIND